MRNPEKSERRNRSDGLIVPLQIDLVGDPWPLGPSTLGAIVVVHFLLPGLFSHFADSLMPGGHLLIETVGGHGANYMELPKSGQLRRALQSCFEFDFYQERKVGPAEIDAVAVRLIARKSRENNER
jgi:hypothetical protein